MDQGQLEQWEKLFPAVDVEQELREMVAWLDANPKRRKTKRGIKRFVTQWLGREQDRGGSPRPPSGESGARPSHRGTFPDD